MTKGMTSIELHEWIHTNLLELLYIYLSFKIHTTTYICTMLGGTMHISYVYFLTPNTHQIPFCTSTWMMGVPNKLCWIDLLDLSLNLHRVLMYMSFRPSILRPHFIILCYFPMIYAPKTNIERKINTMYYNPTFERLKCMEMAHCIGFRLCVGFGFA